MPLRNSHNRSFTIVELLIVVVVLGILAGLAMPFLSDTSLEARVVSAQSTLRTMDTAIDLYHVRYSRPNYPPVIMSNWFVGNQIPPNPMLDAAVGDVEVVNVAGAFNPANKILTPGAKQYWYNRANGVLRARVLAMSTPTATDRLYAIVNNATRAASLGGIINLGISADAVKQINNGALVVEQNPVENN